MLFFSLGERKKGKRERYLIHTPQFCEWTKGIGGSFINFSVGVGVVGGVGGDVSGLWLGGKERERKGKGKGEGKGEGKEEGKEDLFLFGRVSERKELSESRASLLVSSPC